MGYHNSPKWFNISISWIKIFIIVYYTISLLVCIINKTTKRGLVRKSNLGSSEKNTKFYCKLNSKTIQHLNILHRTLASQIVTGPFTPSFFIYKKGEVMGNRRKYSTNSSTPNKGLEISSISERLISIIKELGVNPVYTYENLVSEDIRKQILSETKGLSGVYMIVNKITGDYYIGSAATNRFYARFSNHLIYFRGSKIVKAAVKKYGLENFSFIVLELYLNIVTKENNKELLDLEDRYLKLLLPNYNILTEAGSSFGYKHTEVDRQKMKDVYTRFFFLFINKKGEERREQIGSLNRGKNLSPDTIEKLRKIALNRPPKSDETKLKCITHTRPVVLYNLNRTVYGEYSTILDAAKAINCNEKTIRRALKTPKSLVKRQWIVKDLSSK